jgi:hypothetical protein
MNQPFALPYLEPSADGRDIHTPRALERHVIVLAIQIFSSKILTRVGHEVNSIHSHALNIERGCVLPN